MEIRINVEMLEGILKGTVRTGIAYQIADGDISGSVDKAVEWGMEQILEVSTLLEKYRRA